MAAESFEARGFGAAYCGLGLNIQSESIATQQ